MKKVLIGGLILFLGLTSCVRADYDNILVTKVIDGDTLRLADGEKVRLIGIDTPESEYSYGEKDPRLYKQARRATEFVRELVESKIVRLEFDAERRDKHARLLAYVWYEDEVDSILLNAVIIESGYATPLNIPPNVKYADLFRMLYQKARENRVGLWSD